MMERVKGMIAGFGLIGLAFGVKTVFSGLDTVFAGGSALLLLVVVPPLLSHLGKTKKQNIMNSP